MPYPFKAILIWLGLVLVTALIAALRESLLVPRFGQRVGQVVGGLLLCGAILALTLVWLPHLAPVTTGRCWAVGALWVGLTLTLDWGLGRLARGGAHFDYTTLNPVHQGSLMPLVLVVTLAAPYLAARLLALI